MKSKKTFTKEEYLTFVEENKEIQNKFKDILSEGLRISGVKKKIFCNKFFLREVNFDEYMNGIDVPKQEKREAIINFLLQEVSK